MEHNSAGGNETTVSVCMITLNSSNCIMQALKTVQEVCDEIIVVDGGSDDSTVELVSSVAKVKVFSNPWPGSFALQKNFAMDKANGDWILILDSDEAIGFNMRKKLRKLIQSQRHDCYIFPRYWLIQKQPPLYVKSKKLYPDYQQRLFRNLPHYRYMINRKVHEKFADGVQGVGKKLKDTHIFHFDFLYNDRKAREAKARKRTTLAPELAHINRNQYLFEDAPYHYKIRRCREKLW